MFEFGNCYHYDADKHSDENPLKAYNEDTHLGLWLTGKCVEGSWAHCDENASFYQLKAYFENILSRLGLSLAFMKVENVSDEVFSQALAVTTQDGLTVGRMGIVNAEQTAKVGIAAPVYFAELNWTCLVRKCKKCHLEYREISKFPIVSRDLALLVDTEVSFSQIEEVAYNAERKLLKKVELFDVYEGKNLPEGKKSYAVNFILQDETKTLTDSQIDKAMQRLIQELQNKLKAALR